MRLSKKIFLSLVFLYSLQTPSVADSASEVMTAGDVPLEERYIWVSSENEDEPLGKLPLYPRIQLSAPSETSEVLEQGFAENPREEENLEYLPPLNWRYDAGFEMRTYRLLGPEADVSPSVIMVNEKRSNEYFLFMFFSISIKW